MDTDRIEIESFGSIWERFLPVEKRLCDLAEDIGGGGIAVSIDYAWDGIGSWLA